MGFTGQRLIFLLSQPRSGSTLLQRILGSHPEVHTVSEPWLMLPLLRLLTDRGHQDGPEARFARDNVQAFLKTLPGGQDAYIEGVRRLSTDLYERALAASGKERFLDKTPRYAYMIPELFRTFWEAQFIILFRNPLAVLCSIVQTWTGSDQRLLTHHRYRDSLLSVPSLLLEGQALLGSRCVVVQYERLVEHPELEVRRLCEHLGLSFVPAMIEYNQQGLPHWRFGDQSVYHHARPEASKAQQWKRALHDPQIWRLANDYLQLLGHDTIERIGYSYQSLQDVLQASRPSRIGLWLVTSGLEAFGRTIRRFLRKRWSDKLVTIARRLRQVWAP